MIEESGIEALATDKTIIEEVNLNLKNYEVDNNFTAKLSSDFKNQAFVITKYLDFV